MESRSPAARIAVPPRRVLLIVVPPVDELDLVGAIQVFAMANHAAGRAAYRVELVTTGADLTVRGEGGLLSFAAEKRLDAAEGPYDSALVVCGVGNRNSAPPALTGWLAANAGALRRIGGVCVAAFLLADAGLLEGRRATAHWKFVDEFARRHPTVRVCSAPLWIQDGPIYTSAGVTAGFDLTLEWVESDLGAAVASAVAQELVLFARRPATQAQISDVLTAQASERRQIRELVVWIQENLSRAPSVSALAGRAGMSRRTLERAFVREVGRTPAQYVLEARIAAARGLLETTSRSLEQVARATGFSSAGAMRRAFRRLDGRAPRSWRGVRLPGEAVHAP